MIAEAEIWQVMCSGEVYQADLDTLKQWIAEGLVQPSDQVRKGNLRWIEAGRAPLLRRVFSGEEVVTPAAAPAPETQGTPRVQPVAADLPVYAAPPSSPSSFALPAPDLEQALTDFNDECAVPNFTVHRAPEATPEPETEHAPAPDFYQHNAPPTLSLAPGCYNHPHVAPHYICRVCAALFCAECPKFIEGGTTALCSRCGDFCYLYDDIQAKAARYEHRSSGFGFEDFWQAIRYPFGNVVGLLGMAVVYGLMQLGGWRGQVLAYVVMFGCIALVIKQMAWGRFERSFLPDFTAFSLWDDLVVPCFLGVGITIVTLAPVLLLAAAILFGWFGGKPPAAPPAPTAQQAQSQITEQEFQDFVNSSDPKKDEEFVKKVEQMRRQQYDIAAEGGKREAGMMQNVVRAFMTSPGLILLLGLVAFLWAFFYYPMALTVAGYTEDFRAVVNPLVGLDTMRRMGSIYVKAFLMYAAVELVGSVLAFVIALVLAPFDMPLMGNLPAKFIEGTFTFYFNLVIACILGLALYKSAEKLDIATD